jgi:iron-sulfur cluster repair protein YtfE (RIC family)
MESLFYQADFGAFLLLGQPMDQAVLLERIKAQHREILHKLLPEIDMHFAAVLHNDFQNQQETIQLAHRSFGEFVTLLSDHIYMEDQIVFPELEQNDPIMRAAIASFLENHDDFEMMIHKLLIEISISLKPLQELLPFRILLLKMERLKELLAEHNSLEDLLFADFHS